VMVSSSWHFDQDYPPEYFHQNIRICWLQLVVMFLCYLNVRICPWLQKLTPPCNQTMPLSNKICDVGKERISSLTTCLTTLPKKRTALSPDYFSPNCIHMDLWIPSKGINCF